ncbi:MAG: serine/threonine protein kinase, partial [bacterium]|nr:serine/threonine protein kinase [bacterium]
FIAMEYVWGKDVLQIQNRFRKLRQTMKPEMAAFIAAKLCEGLDYAHKKKDAAGRPLTIIHRDISPQNILISYDGELKIIDFGIAKAASRSSKTQAGVLKGKFGYMSPEQVRGLPLDRRSDVFAIGTILYELLTSDRLFMGESDFETLEKVRNVDVPPVTSINKSVPAELERIINKALARDVDERFQWANEMQEALHAFLLTREPVFTAKQLSAWMREQFALEMKREQQILDEQRKIGKEVLAAQREPAWGKGQHGGNGARDDFGGSTNVLEGAELADLVLAAELSGDSPLDDESAEKTTVQPGYATQGSSSAPLPEQSTQILADALLAKTSPPANSAGAAGETHGHGRAPTELPAQPTVILEGGTGATQLPQVTAPPGFHHAGPQAPTMSAMPVVPPPTTGPLAVGPSSTVILGETSPPYGSAGGQGLRSSAVSGVRNPTTGSVVAPPPYALAGRSTLWKDIAIGVGVAIAVVVGVLGARAMWLRGSKGTLVVMVNAARAADVFVDGALKGHVDPGSPLTVRELAAGAHQVLVKSGDGAEFKQQVALAANDVSVLTAMPRAVAPAVPGTGHLKLNIATDGSQVYVDGAQLAEGAWKDPIPLRADVAHEIRVTKPLREEVRLQVTLRAGEAVMRDVELVPAYGKIVVASEPSGADVSVNGKHSGVTPLTIGDIDPGKPARVTVRLKGYQPVTKYVAFEKGLEQSLDLKLVDETAVSQKSKGKDEELAPVKVASSGKALPATATTLASSSESGFLVANTQPWAKVIIDGKDTGKTTPIAPRSKIALKPGKHVVTFVANGKKFNFDVVIKPAEDTRLIKQLADAPQ